MWLTVLGSTIVFLAIWNVIIRKIHKNIHQLRITLNEQLSNACVITESLQSETEEQKIVVCAEQKSCSR